MRHGRALLAGERRGRGERRLLFPLRPRGAQDDPPLRGQPRSASATAASWRLWPSASSQNVPGAAIASDQLYREADLAIDFREDVEPLPPEAIDRIVALFDEAGAVAKVSSIHVNGWFGEYDKLSMTRIFVRDALGLDLEATRSLFVFCGDSPNDEPMFALLPVRLRRRQRAGLRGAHAARCRPSCPRRAAAPGSSRLPTGSCRRVPAVQGRASAMAAVTVRNIRKSFGDLEVIHGIDLNHRGRQLRRPAGPLRLRQIHLAAHDRRTGADQRGRDRRSAGGW